jgi:hypothetical protein
LAPCTEFSRETLHLEDPEVLNLIEYGWYVSKFFKIQAKRKLFSSKRIHGFRSFYWSRMVVNQRCYLPTTRRRFLCKTCLRLRTTWISFDRHNRTSSKHLLRISSRIKFWWSSYEYLRIFLP